MKNCFLILASTLLLSCEQGPADLTKEGSADSSRHKNADGLTYADHPSTSLKYAPGIVFPDPFYHPGTFSRVNYVYSRPDSSSKIIDTLPFRAPLVILDIHGDFYRVESGAFGIGFIKREDVYTHLFFDDKYDYPAGILKADGFRNSRLQIMRVERDKPVILERFIIPDVAESINIAPVRNITLKDVSLMLHLSYSQSNSCPGIWTDHFIVQSNGAFSDLLRVSSTGEVGYHYEERVYLPVKMENRMVHLVHNGKLAVDELTLEPNVFSYPEDVNVPIEEMVVVEKEDYETFWDDSLVGYVYTEDGDLKKKMNLQVTEYYRWDGRRLSKIK